MTRLTFILLLFIISLPGVAQSKKHIEVQRLFSEAEKKTSDSLYSGAKHIYQKILKTYALDPETFGRVTCNLGYIYLYLGETGEAKKCFEKLINTDPATLTKKQNAGLIITELQPFHKHFAAVNLAEIALKEKKYKLAKYYINLYENKYPYESYCGHANRDYYFYKLQMHGKVAAGLGDTAKALSYLLPEVFSDNNFYLVDLLVEIAGRKYGRVYLLKQLTHSINNLVAFKGENQNGNYTGYSIIFLGKKIDASFVNLQFPSLDHATDSASIRFKNEYLAFLGIPENYEMLPELEYKKLALKESYFYGKLKDIRE